MKMEALSAYERLQIVLLLVQAQYGYPTRVEDIPLDNPATWQLFRQGATERLLHFRATGMKAYLQALHPKKLADLETLLLLYRSPKQCHRIPEFIQWKKTGLPFHLDKECPTAKEILFVKEQVKIIWQTAYLLAHFPGITSEGLPE